MRHRFSCSSQYRPLSAARPAPDRTPQTRLQSLPLPFRLGVTCPAPRRCSRSGAAPLPPAGSDPRSRSPSPARLAPATPCADAVEPSVGGRPGPGPGPTRQDYSVRPGGGPRLPAAYEKQLSRSRCAIVPPFPRNRAGLTGDRRRRRTPLPPAGAPFGASARCSSGAGAPRACGAEVTVSLSHAGSPVRLRCTPS